jgi:hypothetical protein
LDVLDESRLDQVAIIGNPGPVDDGVAVVRSQERERVQQRADGTVSDR